MPAGEVPDVSEQGIEVEVESLFTTTADALPDPALFPDLGVDIWTPELWRANELANVYTDCRAALVLEAVPQEPDDPQRRSCWRWLRDKVHAGVFARPDAPEISESFRVSLREAILADSPRLEPTLELMDVAARGYPDFFNGSVEGQRVLFAPDTFSLWEQYFSTENPLYQPTNDLAACAAAEATRDVGERKLRVLEVGAGCGSGSRTLLTRLGGRVESLSLTDIAPNFLRKAREAVEALPEARGVDVEARMLDLNRPFESWRVEAGSSDLVFAVNVLHTVRDLVASLEGIHRALVDGGRLVLGECVRPGDRRLHPEFVFQLLRDFVGTDEGDRGFLSVERWKSVLREAGFRDVRFVPDFELIAREYSEYSLAAIVATK